MIKPGIGRIVHYRPAGSDPAALPHAAMIVGIHGDRSVNLTIFDVNGTRYPGRDVLLLQDDDQPPADTGYAEWPPFQKAQAVKAEAAESPLLARLDALEKATAEKFAQTGEFLTKRFGELEVRITAAPPAAPVPPDTSSAGAAPPGAG